MVPANQTRQLRGEKYHASIYSLPIGLLPNFPYNVFALINHNGS